MILVDIYVPSINETYDFQLDENTPVQMIVEEIAEMLQRKSTGRTQTQAEPFVLCRYNPGEVLSPQRTLSECGVHNGSRLFIV